MKRNKNIDWVSKWFPIMEANGEITNILYGKTTIDNPETFELHYLKHALFDGIGGMAKLQEDEGVDLYNLPQINLEKISIFRALLTMPRHLIDSKIKKNNFIHFESKSKPKQNNPAFISFNIDETKKIAKYAHDKKVSVNSLLLWSLNKSISNLIRDKNQKNWWLIPSNMRGYAKKSSKYVNQASYLVSKIGDDSVIKIDELIKKQISKNYHLCSWWSTNIGRFFGIKFMKGVLQNYHNSDHSWTGTFSNLGVWNLSSNYHKDPAIWFFCPPVTKAHPIGAGVLTYNHKLTIALQTHVAIAPNDSTSIEICNSWKNNLNCLIRISTKKVCNPIITI